MAQSTCRVTHPRVSRDETIEKMVDLIWDFLVRNLPASDLLIHIHLSEVQRIKRHLHLLEEEGKGEQAATELLIAIKESDEPGKWTVLLEALKAFSGEDSVILHHLLDSTTADPWLDNPEHRKLIALMSKPLHNHLKLEPLLNKMLDRDLINETHLQKLRKKEKSGDRALVQMELIAAMQSHKTDWYRKFITILYEDPLHRELAMMIDPEFCKEKLAASTEEDAAFIQEQEARTGSGDQCQPDGWSTSASSSALHAKSLQNTGHGEKQSPDPSHTEATCGCRCCAQLRVEVTSLKSTVLTLCSELRDIKQLLVETVQKHSQ
ncbi:uncharacterized protein LOC143294721 [Babylonia areolata]|uniref:uncharacterized protein LOC143294721 n=1 Tax=Babylonia areolata TaxID=304850 RepID=UPI003FD1E319